MASDVLTSTGILLRKATQQWRARWSASVANGMTSPQFVVLSLLTPGEPMDQHDIGDRAVLDKASCSYLIDRLVKLGFVKAAEDPADRRRKLVEITPAGRRAFQDAKPGHVEAHRATLVNLTEPEQVQLNRLLRKMLG
jgi:DNA-binding MarR family transcriptional regulator